MDKLLVLTQLADLLNRQKLRWAVGGSLMLYLRGVVSDFEDIDLFVTLEDAQQVIELLDQVAIPQETVPSEQFQTVVYKKYLMDGVFIDVMAGFKVVVSDRVMDCSLTSETQLTRLIVYNQEVPLYTLSEFRDFYTYMNRMSKVELIDAYLQGGAHED